MQRCGFCPPKNSASKKGFLLDQPKVKNELGYTAYDLSLRGGATGEVESGKCFFGKVSLKKLFLFLLLFLCFVSHRM